MFGNNSLPLPSPLAQEHRPLRLTSESGRSQPSGGCHYIQSPSQNRQCMCQTYQQNRAAPGNQCDCGHSACYHAHKMESVSGSSVEVAMKNLTEKLKRMEETIIREREIRDSIMIRERQAWEREIRVLREALAPFYRSEQDMRRKLLELEDRVEGNYDEQIRLREIIMAIDDVDIASETRTDRWGQNPAKKRKISNDPERSSISSPRSGSSSSHSESRAMSQQRSPSARLTDNLRPNGPSSPRSSGILNLVSQPRTQQQSPPAPLPPPPPPYRAARRRRVSPPLESASEVRSSGFLALDFAEHLSKNKALADIPKDEKSPEALDNEDSGDSPTGIQTPPPGIIPPGPLSLPALLSSDSFVHASGRRYNTSPLKRKHQAGLMALDVLANVSVASPPVQ